MDNLAGIVSERNLTGGETTSARSGTLEPTHGSVGRSLAPVSDGVLHQWAIDGQF
jgi:hypothetical protein